MPKLTPTANILLLALLLALLPIGRGHPTRAQSAPALDLTAIDTFVAAQMQRHGIPGLAVGIVEGEQIVYQRGFGKAGPSGQPVTPQTPFLLASVSKPVTALAIMQLVEAGKVELDAPVQRYVPDFHMADAAASGEITVRQLLLHTSGLPVTACDTRIDAETLAAYVAELQTVNLAAPAGERHSYCSGNYNLLGRIIETVSGQSYGSYVQEHVFTPLEMRHSFVNEQEALAAGLAHGYQWLFGLPVPMHHRYNHSQLPSGYLIASVEDMSHFLIAQLNGGRYGNATLLSPEGIAAMHSGGVSTGAGANEYGLGWVKGELGGVPSVFHAGDNYDYHALVFMQPQTQRGAILLVNANNIFAFSTAFQELEAGLARLLAGQSPAAPSLSLPTIYFIVDAVFVVTLALVLVPLVRLRTWQQRYRQRRSRAWLVILRLVGEFGLALALFVGARLVLHGMGAQSWLEGLGVFTDIILWLWALCLLLFITATIRLVLFMRAARQPLT